jgi:hypothetical protein
MSRYTTHRRHHQLKLFVLLIGHWRHNNQPTNDMGSSSVMRLSLQVELKSVFDVLLLENLAESTTQQPALLILPIQNCLYFSHLPYWAQSTTLEVCSRYWFQTFSYRVKCWSPGSTWNSADRKYKTVPIETQNRLIAVPLAMPPNRLQQESCVRLYVVFDGAIANCSSCFASCSIATPGRQKTFIGAPDDF